MHNQYNSRHDVPLPMTRRFDQFGPIAIRLLVDTDAEAFRKLRSHALREFPEAFSQSHDEDRDVRWPDFLQRFQTEWTNEDNIILGAFLNGRLVGSLGLRRWAREKQRHKGYIWIFFVESPVRGKGIGRRLFVAALQYASTLQGLEQIQLSVSTDNRTARRLYALFGFEPFGRERHALKLHDRFIDLELMALHLSHDNRKVVP